jgi:hypothetical protein
MRRLLLSSLAVGLLLAPAGVRAGEDPRAVIERAVKALGGLDRIRQVKAVHRRSKGVYVQEKEVFTSETFSQDPGRLKLVLRSKDPDNPMIRVLVLEGDKGWISFNGVTQDLGADMQARMKRARHADKVAGLTALLRDKEKRYTLTALGASEVKGKPVVGVKVASAGQPDMNLYFDKATGLLVKTAQRVTEPRVDNDHLQEWYYSDYRLLDPAAADEAVLKRAKVAVDGPALLAFLRRRTPGPEMREKVGALIKQLGAPAFRTRTRATDELKKLPPEAGGLLREAVKDPDREVSRRAEQVLEHLARRKDVPLVPAALRLIALRRPPGAAPVLLAYLPWAPDPKAEEEALAALAAVAQQPGKPDPALVAALKDPNARVRQAAAAALGRDGGAYLRRPGRRVVVEGLRYAGRVELYRDGRKEMELEIQDIEVLNRLDDRVFARP